MMAYLYFLAALRQNHTDRSSEYAILLIMVQWFAPIFVRLFNSRFLLRVKKKTTIAIICALQALGWILFIYAYSIQRDLNSDRSALTSRKSDATVKVPKVGNQ